MPLKPLRGYGSLAGQYQLFKDESGKRASLLVVFCPTSAKAAIALAKYNSDLRELGTVNDRAMSFNGRKVPIAVAGDQGAIVAFRQGTDIYIAAAENRNDLPKLLATTPILGGGQVDFVGGKVPVYLNTFDKYGWGFYYNGWWTPPGQELTYDHRLDFAYAKKNGVSLHFQVGVNNSDTAEGVLNWSKFEAGVDIARQEGVPAYIGTFGKAGPDWLMNKYPFEMQMRMPDYVGLLYGPGYDSGGYPPSQVDWSSRTAEDTLLDSLAPIVRKYAKYPNTTQYLEPHEEIEHSTPAIMEDYGPTTDIAYRKYLQNQYGTPQAVDKRWYDGAGTIRSWDDVHVPEVASFLGWGPDAFDLKGVWNMAQDSTLTPADLARWDAVDLDDSKWSQMTAPGDDHTLFLPATHTPGVMRRTFDLPESDLSRLKSAGNGKVYLYVWDMNSGYGLIREAALNGTSVGTFSNPSWDPCWCAFEVSAALRSGPNQLSLHLPFGDLCYKIYLSPRAPRCYPDLSPGEDARWVDFRDFTTWTRGDCIKRGMEMIRREDPDRLIRMPSPYANEDVEIPLSQEFGGEFHDTGGMGGNFEDFMPSLMRGSGLPSTAELGGPAHSADDLKSVVGFYATEGINGVDYFIDMSDIQFNPELNSWFEANQPLIHMFGKYHGQFAQLAVMSGIGSAHLTDFPWNKYVNDLTWGWRRGGLGVLDQVPGPRDAIVESDFAQGTQSKYKVIIDDNTKIMDDALISRIDKWVRAGGIFITYGHSGQHSPTAANAWPISKLTGYKIIGDNDNGHISMVPGQKLLTDPIWSTKNSDGTPYFAGGAGCLLQKVAPECRNILAWDNNQGIALGIRPLGKGYVIASCQTWPGIWPDILRWSGIQPTEPTADAGKLAHFVSNSGLYDVTILFGLSLKSTVSANITWPNAHASQMRDVSTGAVLNGTPENGAVTYSNVSLDPLQTREFLSPRNDIASAPLEWLRLQRGWWGGTRKPDPAPPYPTFSNTIDLSLDNSFSPVPAAATDFAPWVRTKVDDHAWKRMNFGIWSAEFPHADRGVYRKTFTIPATWKSGRSWIWINGYDAQTLRPPYKVQAFLDGQLIWTSSYPYDYMSQDCTKQLTVGTHVLAVVADGSTTMNGLIGNAWVEHLPEPTLRQSLAGSWGPGIEIPGSVMAMGAKKDFVPMPEAKDKTVLLFVDGGGDVTGIFINGRWLGRSPGMVRGDHFRFNITPYIKWGATNTVELRANYNHPHDITLAEVRYYESGVL